MKHRNIGLGTKLELDLYDDDGNKIPAVFISQFGGYDIDTNKMEIYAPIFQGNIYPITPKMQMDVIFSKGKYTYLFTAEAIERVYEDNIALLYIKPISAIEKVERRSFFRMELQLEIQYRTFKLLLPDNEMRGAFIKSITRDISGGGVCLICEENLGEGTYIEAFLELDTRVRFVGVVVRSLEAKNRGVFTYETGVKFVRIENKDREQIISYVFKIQRERLKKGWMKNEQ
ncbi:MAG: PilZ domain-containing protein [Ruminiclostridium sp.]|nr:PilZ domain-containing protein [Ruminiclostridium sp.]